MRIILPFILILLTIFGCHTSLDKSESTEDNLEVSDLDDVLFTLSTIENTLPETNKQSKDSLNLEILEDDWRQLEFIFSNNLDQIHEEFDSINRIIEQESVSIGGNMTGFKKLHVRKLIPRPLDTGIELSKLKESFSSIEFGSLAFSDYGRVNDGVYFEIFDFQLYGIVNDTKVKSLSFYGLTTWNHLPIFIEELKNFMKQHNLVLVDWSLPRIVDSNGIKDYLKPND